MKDEASAAVEWLRDVATLHRKEWLRETARAILAHIAELEARAEAAEAREAELWEALEKADYELKRWKEVESNRPDWEKLWESESNRANEAEAKVAAAEERGLVFNTLPDGRLDFCAIREGSRLWDYRVRAEALTAEVALLREAVTWLLNCHRGLDRHGHGVGGDGYWGNIDAATAFARQALAAAPAAPEKPSEDAPTVYDFRAVSRIDGEVLAEGSGNAEAFEEFKRWMASDANVVVEYRTKQPELRP